jgi:anti-sigma B factor antagonist
MRHEVLEQSGVTVISLEGDVDVTGAPELRDLLAGTIVPGARILLDLTGVAFVDSSGVGVLVTAHRKAAEAEASFGLAAATPTVSRVFELTRTNRLLSIYPTVSDGVSALAGRGA